ncbi:MAG: thymidylate synthase [Nanoarchaeota archaeon]|nr:thymidylate synthase [Nanoarchaeota archaeon]
MKGYHSLARKILTHKDSGYKPNRTGIDTISYFGTQKRFDLRKGFPLLTTKKMFTRGIIEELIWFMQGDTNIKTLLNKNVHIWDDNAFHDFHKKTGKPEPPLYTKEWYDARDSFVQRIQEDDAFSSKHGDLGPIYGRQWRKWKAFDIDEEGNPTKEVVIDQLENLVTGLQKSPSSRRLIVTSWNPHDVPKMALPPCHDFFHVNVQDDNLDLLMYQRSADTFLGVPFNISSYAMLTQILAKQADLKPRTFIHSFGDAHFYCGRGERGEWYKNNHKRIAEEIKEIHKFEDPLQYLDLKSQIESEAPEEKPYEDGLDHVTGILEQLSRTPKPLPMMEIANKPYNELTADDFKLSAYEHHPSIKRRMAV